jgi:hypothetical protein
MRFQTGKYAGKTYETVLLKNPDFAEWMIGNHSDGTTAKQFRALIAIFDRKPFTEKCSCGKRATRASTYRGIPSLMFWCDRCPPHSSGAEASKLGTITTVREALDHINWSANGHRQWKRDIVRSLAQAKGLPKRVGEKQAMDFFSKASAGVGAPTLFGV